MRKIKYFSPGTNIKVHLTFPFHRIISSYSFTHNKKKAKENVNEINKKNFFLFDQIELTYRIFIMIRSKRYVKNDKLNKKYFPLTFILSSFVITLIKTDN